jgi:membrane-bound metal-dependent hydrolase YbcI (DUF457 family)
LILGGATGATVNFAFQIVRMTNNQDTQFDWGELLLCAAVGGVAGLIPDILELADTPNHRGFFHSITAAALVAYLITGEHTGKWSDAALAILTAAGGAYLSHLAADATTPKSIDLI